VHVGDIMVQGDKPIRRRGKYRRPVGGSRRAGRGSRLEYGAGSDRHQAALVVHRSRPEQQVKNIAQPIKTYRITDGTSPTAIPVVGSSLPLPDKPSVAVLPFVNMSGDPEQEYFADGMVEEIITALSRIRWLFVIARNSSFTYRGREADRARTRRPLRARRLRAQSGWPGCALLHS
jgi:hypothetical protein